MFRTFPPVKLFDSLSRSTSLGYANTNCFFINNFSQHKHFKTKFSTLFMLSYDMFPRLWHEWHHARFRMDSTIVLLLFLFFMDRSVLLHVIVNVFGNLSMVSDTSNLWMGRILFFKRLGIIECRSFTWSKL